MTITPEERAEWGSYATSILDKPIVFSRGLVADQKKVLAMLDALEAAEARCAHAETEIEVVLKRKQQALENANARAEQAEVERDVLAKKIIYHLGTCPHDIEGDNELYHVLAGGAVNNDDCELTEECWTFWARQESQKREGKE